MFVDLEMMGWALQIQWLWLRKTDPDKPWQGPVRVHPNAQAMFKIAMVTKIGDGNSMLLWTKKWLMGASIAELVPQVVAAVPAQLQNQRTVAQALIDHS